MGVLGIEIERMWFSTPQQNCHVEPFHSTLKRGCVRERDFESFQDAAAWLPRAHKDYSANRVHSSLGWVPPDGFLRLWERNDREGAGPDDDGGDRGLDHHKNDLKIVLNLWGPDHDSKKGMGAGARRPLRSHGGIWVCPENIGAS